MLRFFTDHPASVGESYLTHAGKAFGFGAALVGAGLACLAHGLMPALFQSTGSRTVRRLYDEMIEHRDARTASTEVASGSESAH